MGLELRNLYDDFRDGKTIKAIAKIIEQDVKKLNRDFIYGGWEDIPIPFEIWLPQIFAERLIFLPWAGCPGLVYWPKIGIGPLSFGFAPDSLWNSRGDC